VAGSTDGVPRKPVHGRHGAADAAVHTSATAAAAASPCSPSSSSLCFWCSAMVLTASWSPWPCVGWGYKNECEKRRGPGSLQDGLLRFLFLELVRGGCWLRQSGELKSKSSWVFINVLSVVGVLWTPLYAKVVHWLNWPRPGITPPFFSSFRWNDYMMDRQKIISSTTTDHHAKYMVLNKVRAGICLSGLFHFQCKLRYNCPSLAKLS
jgi:hypothetical protein